MKTLLYVALLLALLSSCALRKGVSEASLADNPHLRYDIIEKSQLTDGSMIAFYIQHSDTSSVFPESVILCLLDNDTLLYNTYFGHMRPLKPASFGITNPIPMEADVVAAYGAGGNKKYSNQKFLKKINIRFKISVTYICIRDSYTDLL